jgi:hypothetical protein
VAPVIPRRRANLASTVTLGLFFAITLAGLAVGGRITPLLYVLFATLAGFVAYYREPTRYVGFVFGLWFFTPWVRRIIDYHNGFNPTNVVLLAPLLVTMIALLTPISRARELRGSMMYPFIFTFSAVMYGYAVGALKSGFIPATYAMLTWVAPISFSMHLMLSWRIFPRLRDSFLTFLQWALPVIAAYGIYQFVRPPVWDLAWMMAADVASIGIPAPFSFRAFGTLNTPGPYAVALLIGMLFLLGTTRRGLVLSLSLGLVAILLTRTRATWVAFAVGLLVVQFMGPVRRITRNWMILLLMVALALPLLSLDVFRDTISKRLASFATLSQDQSVKQRLIMSREATNIIATRAEGEGLGATGGGTKLQEGGRTASIDNGFLEVFYVLGWPGGSLLMLGLIGHIITLTRFRDARQDAFANSARACFWAMLSVLLIGDIFSGSVGTMYWGCYGFACCAHAYNFALGRGLRSREIARQLVPPEPAPNLGG